MLPATSNMFPGNMLFVDGNMLLCKGGFNLISLAWTPSCTLFPVNKTRLATSPRIDPQTAWMMCIECCDYWARTVAVTMQLWRPSGRSICRRRSVDAPSFTACWCIHCGQCSCPNQGRRTAYSKLPMTIFSLIGSVVQRRQRCKQNPQMLPQYH